jgi:hypothetical protein
MDNVRKNNLSSERGVAIITSLIIAMATVALIGGVYYMLQSGIKTTTINRQFSNTQEAAFGGIEHGATIIKNVMSHAGTLSAGLQTGLGIPDTADYEKAIYKCDPSEVIELKLRTAGGRSADQGQFHIRLTVQCINPLLIPGSESLIFPPPAGGTGGNKSYYVFYLIRSTARDSLTNTISDVEAVYRVAI